ncbi:PREDICTED: uncharacterized protein LOC109355794 isoform X2 [Lupinus angustifolius]|nr:PREDICTED: uncharacterized protein LOC109355794 isoform X2 [Lupinus angustifolius]
MKIQPIDSKAEEEMSVEVVKPVARSRIKRLFERQFSVLKYSAAADKITAAGDGVDKGSGDFEPSSVCLAKMVQNFMEGGNHDKHSVSSNCFNGNCDYGSDAESETYSSSTEALKGLVACASVCERNLLADTAKIVEKNKVMCKRKDQVCRNVVTEGLIAFGYDASVCKSRWEKSPYYPSGEYEYIDVMIGKERVLIDIDFRAEFEIARSTKAYKAILQSLPYIFVGKCDRLQSIVAIASEAAKQSLKKKGMPVPPWRKLGYVKAKWLSTYIRTTITPTFLDPQTNKEETKKQHQLNKSVLTSGVEDKAKMVVVHWKLPEAKPKSIQSGLAAFFAEKS